MVHLSSNISVSIMIFYSLLTFFIVPHMLFDYTKKYKDPCMIGMIVGFIISILLWHFLGKNYVYTSKKI